MSESQGGAGRREVAYRLFATEFDDADFSYSESDEERAPNYVVTPTGGRVNRLFVVGVLTEIETVSEDYLRARVVDPTGPFVVYAGQYQPEALAFLERADPPAFVAVTGKARTYQPDDSDQVFTSIRPESISEVDAATRDRWVVQTAEHTLDRVGRMAEAKQSGLAGDDLRRALVEHDVEEGLASGIAVALEHYGTTGEYLASMRDLALDAARVVAGEIDEVDAATVSPDAGGDDAVASLVERPIGDEVIEAVTEPDEEETPADAPADTDEAVAAEAGTGNGSAIGTASSGGSTGEDAGTAEETAPTETADTPQADAGTREDSPETSDVDEEASSSTAVEASDLESATETTDTTNTADATETADSPETADTGGTATATETTETPDVSDETDAVDATASADAADAGGDADAADGEADDLDDFEPEFDLDEEEREQIKEEFGTEFQSGTEVDEPGAADIETPDPEPTGEETETVEGPDEDGESAAEEPGTDQPASGADDETSAAEPEADAGEEAAEPAGDVDLDDVDLEDAVMDAMEDLDEGDGANREELVAAVVDRTGADPGDVEDAIQDALMGGRCYEPDDETLKPI